MRAIKTVIVLKEIANIEVDPVLKQNMKKLLGQKLEE